MAANIPFRTFGPMYDVARNAVLNLDSIKKLVDICADCDYTAFMLYLEDVFEVDDNPYFGHGRGRYSKQELKEIDEYCTSKGLEFMPCIQTLAHLDGLVKWPKYSQMKDCGNILLIGDERVYELIDKIFSTLSQCVSTKTINVGMDEALMVGRGKYYNLHGDSDHSKILVEHLNKVSEIAKKYGYKITMWSDMFYRIATGGEYYNANVTLSDELKAMIPDNVELIYWDYYSADEKHYDGLIEGHEKMKKGTWFAGVLGACRGFTPVNGSSIKNTKPALQSCISHGIKDVMLTAWADDGGECSRFSTLPSLFYASEIAKGNHSMKSIKEKFKQKFDISWDAFMTLDLINGKSRINPTKYMFYNDLFVGLMDTKIPEGIENEFTKLSRKLGRHKKHEQWGFLFETSQALCRVLEIKANLGNELRAAYKSGDKKQLEALILKCKELKKRIEVFYKTFKKQWMIENKAFGFDVQNIRIGGLIARVAHCTELLTDYVEGRLDRIEELEIEAYDYWGAGTERKPYFTTIDYGYAVSPNVLLFNNYVG